MPRRSARDDGFCKGATHPTRSQPPAKDIAMAPRLSYELSCNRLRELKLLADDDPAPIPDRLPRHDDEEPLGVMSSGHVSWAISTCRIYLYPEPSSGVQRSTAFRCEIVTFTSSNLCWNDFVGADFTGADLSRSDMRSSIFKGVRFVATNLEEADLRRSTFTDCVFEGAVMRGSTLTPRQGETMLLTETQRREIKWVDEDGPQPDGG